MNLLVEQADGQVEHRKLTTVFGCGVGDEQIWLHHRHGTKWLVAE